MKKPPQEKSVLTISLEGQAGKIRKLFMADQATRRAFGGPPYSEDIFAELNNAHWFHAGKLNINTRGRIRLGDALWYLGGESHPLGYIGITLVNKARPTAYEQKYVWGGKAPALIDGIFVRRLVVDIKERGRGHGARLLNEELRRARELGKRLYCDTKADNIAMRKLAQSLGGAENMFWSTPNNTLMVRYIWC